MAGTSTETLALQRIDKLVDVPDLIGSAGNTRKDIEQKTGKKIVSEQNYLNSKLIVKR